MKRRRFFSRLAQAAGLIALAPQLAFRAPTVTTEMTLNTPIYLPAGYGLANTLTVKLSPEEIRRLFLSVTS